MRGGGVVVRGGWSAEACDFECYMGGPEGHVEFRLCLAGAVSHQSLCSLIYSTDACHACVPKLSRHNRTLVINCALTVQNIRLVPFCFG